MTEKSGAQERKKKNLHHEGNVRLRADGRHEARITLPDGTRRSVYGTSEKDVKGKMKKLMEKAGKGIDVRGERQTLATFLRSWLDDVAADKVRPSTLVSYRHYVERHIIPGLGDAAIGDLTVQDVQRFLNARHKAGLSPRTVQYIRAILRSALAEAVAWSLVERNVAAIAKPPRQQHKEVTALSSAEARQLMAFTREHRLGNLFAIALFTGMRQGELLGLRWPDLDLDAGSLTVRQAAQKIGGEWKMVEPKSATSRRTIKLPAGAVAALRDQKERVKAMRREAGELWVEWGLVFPSQIGSPLDGPSVTHALQRQLEAAGLPKVRFHDLRHTCATMLLEQSVPARVVMDQLGHSQISLTLNTYSHVLPAMRDDAANALDRALGEA